MTRYARRLGLQDKLKVVVVARTWEDLPYAAELQRYGAFIALTRENLGDRVAAPPYPSEMEEYVAGVERAYVCGSVGFASYATRLLGESGVRSDTIRVEQFGETS
jgi:ferredoxin-NADP reductase